MLRQCELLRALREGQDDLFLKYQTYTFLFRVLTRFLSAPSDPHSKLDLRSLFGPLSFLLFRSMFNYRWPLLLCTIPSGYLIFLGFLHFDEENMLLTVGGCKELECSPSQLTSGRDFVLL